MELIAKLINELDVDYVSVAKFRGDLVVGCYEVNGETINFSYGEDDEIL